MKKYLGILATGAVIVAGFSTPGVASRFAQSETITQECTDMTDELAGTITYVGPTELWPPNHKYVPATITWTDEDCERRCHRRVHGQSRPVPARRRGDQRRR